MRVPIFGQIVAGKLLPHLVGGYPNDRVLTCIEIRRQMEKFHPNRALFQSAARTSHGVLYGVLKELPASLAIAKRRALQEAAEFRPHNLLARFVEPGLFFFGHSAT
jgi:hypothetical protein